MIRAIKAVSSERGRDPREYANISDSYGIIEGSAFRGEW